MPVFQRLGARMCSVIVAGLIGGTALAGCAPEAPMTPQTTHRETSAPTATTATTTPEPIERQATQIPTACDAILPLNIVHGYDARLVPGQEGADVEATLSDLLGPTTMGALRAGSSHMFCSWGIPQSDAMAFLGVATIDDQAKTELLATLRQSVYVEVDAGGAEAVFQQGQSFDHRYTDDIVIDGDLLVAVAHTISGDFARDACTTVQATQE
ncbi:hypothetical protein MUN77_08195 [Leucobacter allii]|uniref:hypothetical protein n=1 Tax=Leucobacter allii TaxID=2932247 RepID=UPI001FD5F7BA|nr:hypothetical protein [Leucobacter allii]UOR03250.1 hypothetical protein MUN77_08195 [Leucobacter allii]